LTEDPAAADVNLYRYCGNAPTDGIDPSGEVNSDQTWNEGFAYVQSTMGMSAQAFRDRLLQAVNENFTYGTLNVWDYPATPKGILSLYDAGAIGLAQQRSPDDAVQQAHNDAVTAWNTGNKEPARKLLRNRLQGCLINLPVTKDRAEDILAERSRDIDRRLAAAANRTRWEVDDLLSDLNHTREGAELLTAATRANGGMKPRILKQRFGNPFKGDVDLKSGTINLYPVETPDRYQALEVLAFELANLSQKAAFDALDAQVVGRGRCIDRDTYIQKREALEFESFQREKRFYNELNRKVQEIGDNVFSWAEGAKTPEDLFPLISEKHKEQIGAEFDQLLKSASRGAQ
jgi:hypothetical protein